VLPATISDRDGAVHLLGDHPETCPRLQVVWADRGDTGATVAAATAPVGVRLIIVAAARRWGWYAAGVDPPPPPVGFPVQPRRWVVERTFAWLGKQRRLAKDDEHLPETEEAWIDLTMIRLLIARLAA
jgi:putative transposase